MRGGKRLSMRIHYIVVLFLGAGLLISCGTGKDTVNTRISAGTLAAINKGATTKEQVRVLLGDPQSRKTQAPVRQLPGVTPLPAKYAASEIWAFWTDINKGSSFHLPFSSRAAKPPCTVIIYFDERGTVLDCETSGELPK